MKKETTRGRLSVHRQTFRTLTAGEMAVVAGGISNPRSNAWTARSGNSMGNEICGGVVK